MIGYISATTRLHKADPLTMDDARPKFMDDGVNPTYWIPGDWKEVPLSRYHYKFGTSPVSVLTLGSQVYKVEAEKVEVGGSTTYKIRLLEEVPPPQWWSDLQEYADSLTGSVLGDPLAPVKYTISYPETVWSDNEIRSHQYNLIWAKDRQREAAIKAATSYIKRKVKARLEYLIEKKHKTRLKSKAISEKMAKILASAAVFVALKDLGDININMVNQIAIESDMILKGYLPSTTDHFTYIHYSQATI